MNSRIMTISISEYFKKRIYLVVFILGLVIGTFAINTLSKSYYDKINVTQDHYMEMISDVVVNKSKILLNGIYEYFKEFAIILILNCFFFGKIYNALYLFVKGASVGIIISSYVMKYGVGGLLIYIISIFPHYILYIPAIILTICAGISLRNVVSHNIEKNGKYSGKDVVVNDVFRMFGKMILYFGIIFFFALLISLLEAYINIPIFKSCLKKT